MNGLVFRNIYVIQCNVYLKIWIFFLTSTIIYVQYYMMVIISRDVSMYPATLKTGHLIHFLKKLLNFFFSLEPDIKRPDWPAGRISGASHEVVLPVPESALIGSLQWWCAASHSPFLKDILLKISSESKSWFL